MQNRMFVSSSPHIRSSQTVQSVMRDVTLALLPATAFGILTFGTRALVLVILAVLTAIGTEAFIQVVMRKQKATIKDLSAVVTGLLLALNIPVTAPFWLVIIGAIFAIAIVKHAFGGLGHNFMNPALAARAMLMASWPVEMTSWVSPGADAVASATPLGIIAEGLPLSDLPSLLDLFIGNVGGCIGETSAGLILLGGLYLLFKKVINWRIPVIYIGTVFVFALMFQGFDGYMAMFHVLSGGLMLGAFFMATDYASSPVSPKGQIIYAFGCGLLTILIRQFGALPEGVSYSILLMNVATPIIEKYTAPRVFGGAKA
jgi:electron transport complex protein RnfD